jgi:hypothetical protein
MLEFSPSAFTSPQFLRSSCNSNNFTLNKPLVQSHQEIVVLINFIKHFKQKKCM